MIVISAHHESANTAFAAGSLTADAPAHVRERVVGASASELRRGLAWEHGGDRYRARLTREPAPKLVIEREGAPLMTPLLRTQSAVRLGVAALQCLGLWTLALGLFAAVFDQRFLMLTGHGYNAILAGAALIASASLVQAHGAKALVVGVTVTLLNATVITIFVLAAGGRFPLITWILHIAVALTAVRAARRHSGVWV